MSEERSSDLKPTQQGVIDGAYILDEDHAYKCLNNADDTGVNRTCYPGRDLINYEIRPDDLLFSFGPNSHARHAAAGERNITVTSSINSVNYGTYMSQEALLQDIRFHGVAMSGQDLNGRMSGSTRDTETGGAYMHTGKFPFYNPPSEKRTIYPGDALMYELYENKLTEGEDFVPEVRNMDAPADRTDTYRGLKLVYADPMRTRPSLAHAHTLCVSEYIKLGSVDGQGMESGINRIGYTKLMTPLQPELRVLSAHQEHAVAFKFGMLQPGLAMLWTLVSNGFVTIKNEAMKEAPKDVQDKHADAVKRSDKGEKLRYELIAVLHTLGGILPYSMDQDNVLKQFYNRCFLDNQGWSGTDREQALRDFQSLVEYEAKSAKTINAPKSDDDDTRILGHILACGADRQEVARRMSFMMWGNRIVAMAAQTTLPGQKRTAILGYNKTMF